MIFLLSPKDITDYTVVDIEYWRETKNRLLIKTAYEYNNKSEIEKFPKELGEWKGVDFKYPDRVYKTLNADIVLSRSYIKNQSLIWVDIVNSKKGESFHKQQICMKGSGWDITESIAEFKIADPPNPFTKLYTNRLDLTKGESKEILLYWFMFKKFGSNDAVTMIRVTSPSINTDIDTTFDITKNFLEDQLFGAMYKDVAKEEITNAENIYKNNGIKGILIMIMGILIPLGITIIGAMKKE